MKHLFGGIFAVGGSVTTAETLSSIGVASTSVSLLSVGRKPIEYILER